MAQNTYTLVLNQAYQDFCTSKVTTSKEKLKEAGYNHLVNKLDREISSFLMPELINALSFINWKGFLIPCFKSTVQAHL